MARFNEFYDIHEKWDVETFTFGSVISTNIFMNKLLPLIFARGNNKIEDRKTSASGSLLKLYKEK